MSKELLNIGRRLIILVVIDDIYLTEELSNIHIGKQISLPWF